jgi:hypothetical protein
VDSLSIPKVDLATLRKLTPRDVRLLWVDDWYDGPLEAMVEHDGERCLMVLYDREVLGTEEPYRWLLVRLTPEQRADEEKWHDLFAKHVGEHWCMHPETPHQVTEDEPIDPDIFYRAYAARAAPDFSKNEAIGWLDEMPAA